ncbi:MAG: SIMPL domain-containing protein [Bacteroidales bacterium]|jgi:uncharacterized protein YggE|nr:SIMPL domain-containing protein [Bacteroidales bacterium]
MKKSLLLAITILLALGSAGAQESPEPGREFIDVSASISKDVTPDEIYVGIIINERDNKGKASVEQQEKNMIKLLEEMGTDPGKNLTVDHMDSSLQKYFMKKNAIYATKSYTLKLSDEQQLAAVFDALNSIKISEISLKKTRISDELQEKVKREMLTEAASKARKNAEILAEAVGSKAGGAIYIHNSYSLQRPSNRILLKSETLEVAGNGSTIESIPSINISKTTVFVSVECKFRLLSSTGSDSK